MAAQWYYRTWGGHEHGPVDVHNLRALARQGIVNAMTQVREGLGGRWVQANEVTGLLETGAPKSISTRRDIATIVLVRVGYLSLLFFLGAFFAIFLIEPNQPGTPSATASRPEKLKPADATVPSDDSEEADTALAAEKTPSKKDGTEPTPVGQKDNNPSKAITPGKYRLPEAVFTLSEKLNRYLHGGLVGEKQPTETVVPPPADNASNNAATAPSQAISVAASNIPYRFSMKIDFLGGLVKQIQLPSARKEIVEETLKAARQAMDEGELPAAHELLKLARDQSAQLQIEELTRNVQAAQKELDQAVAAAKQLQTSLSALMKNPNDPEANLAVGRYTCLSKNEWEDGLLLLAQGGHHPLAALARDDLNSPTDANAQIKLADGWWDLAQSQRGSAQENAMGRAAKWYAAALPNVPAGDLRAKLEKRIAEAAKLPPKT